MPASDCRLVACEVLLPTISQTGRPQRQHIVLNDKPSLRRRVRTGSLEVRHLPVTDLGGLREIVQSQLSVDSAGLVVDHDFQQPQADYFGCLLAWTFPNDPGVGCPASARSPMTVG
jgi:hypothetical protein